MALNASFIIHDSSFTTGPARRGFTLLEFVVAMAVFSVALSGLVPLLAILSRDLQPLRKSSAPGGYDCFTPARDGNTTGANLVYQRHPWYFSADVNPWVRKLGASAALATAPASGTSPVPIQSAVEFQDDYELGSQTAQDGPGTYAGAGDWTNQANGSDLLDYHYHKAPLAPDTTTDNATWNLSVATSGWYSIQASWPADFRTTNPGWTLGTVPYSVTNTPAGGTAVTSGPFAVDQTQDATTGVSDGVRVWWNVTGPINLQKGAVVVTLSVPQSTSDTCYVLADGIRIVRNDLKVRSVQRSLSRMNGNSDGCDAKVNVSVTVNLCK
jgi:prepilin-type N-terminal cleavage/methylation domain-containing protein